MWERLEAELRGLAACGPLAPDLLAGNPNGDPFGFGAQAGYRTDPETGLADFL